MKKETVSDTVFSMKYHMRRIERQLKDWPAIEEVLRKGRYAILALCRDNEPYVVTLSYGYESATRSLYFHCAKDGLKTQFITANPSVCATIIQDNGYIQNECGHAYRSVVVRGKIEVLSSEADKKKAVDVMLDHLEEKPEIMRAKLPGKTASFNAMRAWRLVIEEITAKEGR
jgi:nitroimidazol reductase NimA-like FMN-containing flavoprotein (pyridoxamine 5'-phosphate oxidase superfamily)